MKISSQYLHWTSERRKLAAFSIPLNFCSKLYKKLITPAILIKFRILLLAQNNNSSKGGWFWKVFFLQNRLEREWIHSSFSIWDPEALRSSGEVPLKQIISGKQGSKLSNVFIQKPVQKNNILYYPRATPSQLAQQLPVSSS